MNNLTSGVVKKLYWQEQSLGLVKFGGRENKENKTLKTRELIFYKRNAESLLFLEQRTETKNNIRGTLF